MWIALIPISVAVYFATGSPLLASSIPYLAAAEPSIQSGIWLRFHDPLAARGKTCCWFYLATAGWMAATTAFFHVVLFMVISGFSQAGPPRAGPLIEEFARVMIALLVGLGISTIVGIIGMVCAFRRKLRVFVTPRLYKRCGGDFANIGAATGRRQLFNHAIFIVAGAVFVPPAALGLAMSMFGIDAQNPAKMSPVQTAGLLLIGIGTVTAIPVYAYFSHRIVARNASECWPTQWPPSATPLHIVR